MSYIKFRVDQLEIDEWWWAPYTVVPDKVVHASLIEDNANIESSDAYSCLFTLNKHLAEKVARLLEEDSKRNEDSN